MKSPGRAPTDRRWRRVLWLVCVGVLVLIVAAGVWVAVKALTVRGELSAIGSLEQRAASAFADSEPDEIEKVAREFGDHARAARDAASDPVWRVAEVLPYVGANLHATRVASEQIAAVSEGVVDPLSRLLVELGGSGVFADGRFDVETIASAHAPAAGAAIVLDDAQNALSELDRGTLLPEVASGLDDVAELIGDLEPAVTGAADLTGIVPAMLGADGPRTILVMIQNNAELRSGGGITGSFAEFRADTGQLTLTRQADSGDFARTGVVTPPIPESTTALYGDVVGRFVQNATATPDFDLSARLASAWWESLTDRTPDVVVSIDPLVLRSLLAVTGPIELAGGAELIADSFVRDVMVRPYLTLSTAEQTQFFEDLTQRFVTRLMASDASPSTWIAALTPAVDQGRVSVWSPIEAESDVLAGTTFAGPRARHEAASDSTFAVYLNDATGSKMDSSLEVGFGAAEGSCRADEKPEVAVRVQLTNTAPEDAGERWPFSMTGGGYWGVRPGDIATVVAVAAPAGWFFGGVTVDGERQSSVDVEDGGLPTTAVEVTLEPGQSAVAEIRFVSPHEDALSPELLHTPLLRAADELGSFELNCS